MNCDNCGKNEASIHFIKVFDNSDIKKIDLCKDCARNLSFLSDEDFFGDLTKILSNIFELDNNFYNEAENLFNSLNIDESKKCSFCNITLGTIKKLGQIGCPKCYEEFYNELMPLIKIIQAGMEHRGKIPVNCNKKLKIEKEIIDLRYKLKEEIFIENFEEAAKLRDKINSLKKILHFAGKEVS